MVFWEKFSLQIIFSRDSFSNFSGRNVSSDFFWVEICLQVFWVENFRPDDFCL